MALRLARRRSDCLLARVGDHGAVVEEQFAIAHELSIGDTVTVTAAIGRTAKVTVLGVFRDPCSPAFSRARTSGVTVSASLFDKLGLPMYREVTMARRARQRPGRAEEGRRGRPEPTTRPTVYTQDGYKDGITGQIDKMLTMLYALLAMSVLISVFGIVNTLVLSVYERTREIGMLRAIGASRRQIRRMVRYESVITSAIGGVLGIAVGVVFAYVVTNRSAGQGFGFSVPYLQLVVFLIVAMIVGVRRRCCRPGAPPASTSCRRSSTSDRVTPALDGHPPPDGARPAETGWVRGRAGCIAAGPAPFVLATPDMNLEKTIEDYNLANLKLANVQKNVETSTSDSLVQTSLGREERRARGHGPQEPARLAQGNPARHRWPHAAVCARSRRRCVHDHRQPASPRRPHLRVRRQLAHEVRDVGHVGLAGAEQAVHQSLVQRVLRDVALHQRVRTDGHPLHERIGGLDVVMEEVRGALIVPRRRDEAAQRPDDRPLERPRRVSRPPGRFTETLLMRMSLTGCAGRSSRAARYTLSTDRRTRSRGGPNIPCSADDVAETRDDRVAAVDLLPELLVAQRQQVGLDHRQPAGRPRRPAGSRSADRTMARTRTPRPRSCSRTRRPCARYRRGAERSSLPLRVLEHLVERHSEHPGDLERHLERRRVAALLDRDHRLPRDADLVGQLGLGHLAVGEPERPDAVGHPRRLDHG